MTRRLVIIGGGTAGLAVANQLRRRLRSDEIILVSTQSYMTYQPLLPEVAGHTVPAAHVVVPLRRAAPGVRVIVASMTDLDVDAQTVGLAASDGSRQTLVYDELVLALGSVARTFPIPGLTEHSVGFRTVEEAQHVGSRVLEKLELAAGTNDPDVRRRASTFVFVGGGHSGVEALAELEDMGRRYLERQGLQGTVRPLWVLVEAGDRILGAMPDRLGTYVDRHLTKRGVDIKTGLRVERIDPTQVAFSDGTTLSTETVVWTAGVVAPPVLRSLGLSVDAAGRVVTDLTLRVRDGIWALGDCAAVPDPHTGGTCPPTAQHAVRQATCLARNLRSRLGGGHLRDYEHRDVGAVASLGPGKGVAELYGLPLRGFVAWLVHRSYHGLRLPCGRRRILVVMNWLLAPISDDPVSLSNFESPREPLRSAHDSQRS